MAAPGTVKGTHPELHAILAEYYQALADYRQAKADDPLSPIPIPQKPTH